MASDGTSYTGTTDANGHYLIQVPANDTYSVQIETLPGTAPTAGSEDATASSDGSEDNRSHNGSGTTVVIGTSDNLTLDFGFTESVTASIGNLFWIDSNGNGIVDNGEQGLNGVTVELLDDNGNILETQITHNDSEGRPGYYLFEGLTPNQEYHVHFDYSQTDLADGYIFSPVIGGNNTNNANGEGLTIAVTPHVGENIFILDAGINCGCANIVSDSVDALGILGALFMILMLLAIVLLSHREGRELHA